MLKGKRQLQARFRAIGKAPEVIVRTVVIRGVAEAKHLVHRRTGNLGRTIRPGAIRKDYGEIIAGGTRNVGYARAEERGHKAYTIVPKRKKVLAWGGSRTLSGRLSAGSKPTHFATKVKHKATKGHPYLKPGLQQAVKIVGIDAVVTLWNGAA